MFTGRGIAFGATGSNTIVGTLLALDLDELELGRTASAAFGSFEGTGEFLGVGCNLGLGLAFALEDATNRGSVVDDDDVPTRDPVLRCPGRFKTLGEIGPPRNT